MAESDWLGEVPKYPRAHDPTGEIEDSDVCPGYLIAIPDVLLAYRAHLHWKHGSLDARLDGMAPTPLLMDLVEHVCAASASLEHAVFEESKAK